MFPVIDACVSGALFCVFIACLLAVSERDSFLLQVKIRDGAEGWGWGVVVHVVKKQSAGQGNLPSSILTSPRSSFYLVDTLLHCSSTIVQDGSRQKPRPCLKGEKGEMQVVSFSFFCSCDFVKNQNDICLCIFL